ncbi:hypothetical protein [Magnetospirillum sp. UT-4]|uniref:hypothetical protein n=1 Tax=Magnetospirillum sp. UT-4 TaxID=2681467 RepID=UPI00138369F5|nr:hypothetical protein [Magnetospirillum sp. UT-4]CAA7613482.1 hypothetical protein MTBUT4_150011 [Magnetospirillum sp. UT-4]
MQIDPTNLIEECRQLTRPGDDTPHLYIAPTPASQLARLEATAAHTSDPVIPLAYKWWQLEKMMADIGGDVSDELSGAQEAVERRRVPLL